MKKKGFTLIELVVVVAIILVLAATLAPKLRNEVAKARDAKAVSALGAVRTAINVYYADKEDAVLSIEGGTTALINSSGDSEYLEAGLVTYLTEVASVSPNATVKVGGSKSSDDATDVTFGGYVDIDYDSSKIEAVLNNTTTTTATVTDALEYDTKGNAWASY